MILLLRRSPGFGVCQCRSLTGDGGGGGATSKMKVDVVVAGGGMVGSAAAGALAQLGCLRRKKVLLLEAAGAPEKKTVSQYSNRVSALAPSSVRLLSQLGAWSAISQSRLGLVTRMKVWDSSSRAAIVFSSQDNLSTRDQPLNYIVENDLTVSALTEVMKACDNLIIKYGAKVKRYKIPHLGETDIVPKENVEVELEDGSLVETKLLVGADGFRSLVRQSIGSDYHSWNYPQMGLVATLNIATKSGSNSTAWQRFLPSGPVALLPLSADHSSLVWTVDKAQVKPLLEMSEEAFVKKLNRALTSDLDQNQLVNSVTRSLGQLVGRENSQDQETPPLVRAAANRAAFPLGFGHAVRYSGPRTVLIGDSAHRLHPLAGQGVNLGLGDVSSLVRVVEDSLRSGSVLGQQDSLEQYETERQRHNLPTMLGVDALQRLYSSQATPVVLARSLGLLATDAVNPVKTLIMKHAG